jgi:hypothetical protein
VRRISGGIAAAGASSKLNAGRDFLRLLRDEGGAAPPPPPPRRQPRPALHARLEHFAGGGLTPGQWTC